MNQNDRSGALSRRGLVFGAAAGAGLLLLPRPSVGRCVFPAEETLHYEILRGGERVGAQTLAFLRSGGDFIAHRSVRIRVERPGAGTYRYRHRGEETWRHGWLVGLRSETLEEGRRTRLEAERRAGALRIRVDGRLMSAAGYLLTTALWHRDTPYERGLLDVETGYIRLVRGWDLGEDRVLAAGERLRARHFSITGEVSCEVWYDFACRLVRTEYSAALDGARIVIHPV